MSRRNLLFTKGLITLILSVSFRTSNGANVTLEMLEKLNFQMQQVTKEMGGLRRNMGVMQLEVEDLRRVALVVNSLEVQMNKVGVELSSQEIILRDLREKNVPRLERENAVWRNNFRVINNTFARLRNKIYFQQPAINLVG